MELQKQVTIVKQKQKTQAVCVITIKKIKMSEQELKKAEIKFEQRSKIAFVIPFVVLMSVLLFLSSCSSSSYTSCAAYASVECENCDEID